MKKEDKSQDKMYISKVGLPIVLFLLYLFLDYCNIPRLIGISIDRINIEFFNTLLNSTIVVVLYTLTYYFVDRRQIQKDKNVKDTADVLILCTYKECLDNLSLVTDYEWVSKYIIPKLNGDIPVNDNIVISNIQNFPFASKSEILELSKGGYLKKTVLSKYCQIQKDYKSFISLKITFYDLITPETDKQRELYFNLEHRYNSLLHLLNAEIERLEEDR